jgi:hypothetical protein
MSFAPPLDPRAMPDDARLRDAVRAALAELEQRWDPAEAALAEHAPQRDRAPRGDAAARLQ